MTLERFLAGHTDVVAVRVASARGSAPRDAGTAMYVSDGAIHGTIGGGQLEYMALDRARRMLANGEHHTVMNVPLGPEIGQCCGGHVTLELSRLDGKTGSAAVAGERAAARARPRVLIFGAGHVGRALARALAPLPLSCCLIDSREAELALAECGDRRLTPLPEGEIASAPAGAAHVIATHDHALDFLLASEALARGDAAYVGMIGSATKRVKFETWCRRQSPAIDGRSLVCPIGRAGLGDKRPEVIAAFVAVEVISALSAHETERKAMEIRA